MKIEAMLERLWRGDQDARDELRKLGAKAAIAAPDLADAVAQGSPRLQKDALFVLEGLGEGARPALSAMIAVMQGDDPDLACAAADALGALGIVAVSDLTLCLSHKEDRVRILACRGLGAIGPAANLAVVELLRLSDRDTEDVRRRAIGALGRIGAAEALEPLAAMLTDEGGEIGCCVADALAMYGRDARPVADALRDELHRDDHFLALACADALRAIGRFQDAAIWALISCLQTPHKQDVRIESAILLGDYGAKATASLPALHAAQSDSCEELRAQAAMAIAKIRPVYAAARRDGAAAANQ